MSIGNQKWTHHGFTKDVEFHPLNRLFLSMQTESNSDLIIISVPFFCVGSGCSQRLQNQPLPRIFRISSFSDETAFFVLYRFVGTPVHFKR